MKQSDIVMESEGDAWFARNAAKMGKTDEVAHVIKALELWPRRVLEIGCADGWRLANLRNKYSCEIMGIEPSKQAGIAAAARMVPVYQATATALPLCDPFDMVIYGFCLYLTDPEDWLLIAAEGDRLLQPGGHLIIHDFAAHGSVFAKQYKHRKKMLAYHYDFARLWLGHPLYFLVTRIAYPGGDTVVVLEKKPVDLIDVADTFDRKS